MKLNIENNLKNLLTQIEKIFNDLTRFNDLVIDKEKCCVLPRAFSELNGLLALIADANIID